MTSTAQRDIDGWVDFIQRQHWRTFAKAKEARYVWRSDWTLSCVCRDVIALPAGEVACHIGCVAFVLDVEAFEDAGHLVCELLGEDEPQAGVTFEDA